MRPLRFMKFVLFFMILPVTLHAQRDRKDSHHLRFHLSADSINTRRHFYVNVDAVFRKGRFQPVDARSVTIRSDYGRMSGNKWMAPFGITFKKVHFHAFLNGSPGISADTTVWLTQVSGPRDDMPVEMDLPLVPENLKRKRP